MHNLTENTKDNFNVKGIKNKNNISYIQDDTKFKIKIINQNKLILTRENKEMMHNFIFDKNHHTLSTYTLKENMISVDIEVIVDLLDIKEEEIKVRYKIPDTQTLYEYKIEMRNNL